VRDITERKQAEEALKSSRLRAETEKRYLEAIFQVLPVGLVVTDTKGGVIRTNNMDKKIWGLRPNTRDVDDYVQYKAWWADSGKPIESQEWASAQAVLIGKSVIGQVLKIKRFNGEHGYIINSAAPIFNDEGRVSGSAVVIQDITELRRAQQAKLESIQNLNEYAYALTHNLKAPFRAIQNYAEFLTEDLEDILEWEPKQYLEGLKKAVTQANNQFRDLEILYEIANRHINIETFDMKEVLNEMQSTFQDVSDSQLILHKNWPAFRGERHLIRQILINLIDNGFKFNRADVKRVEVGWQAVEGNRIEIFVRDNGIGIDPQYQVQIFDIFKRLHTDREYGGTGIGLAIVKKALQKIGGEMRLTSAIGEGSTFYINLPNTFLENNQA
jgi:PAS domain S-box-containing protein